MDSLRTSALSLLIISILLGIVPSSLAVPIPVTFEAGADLPGSTDYTFEGNPLPVGTPIEVVDAATGEVLAGFAIGEGTNGPPPEFAQLPGSFIATIAFDTDRLPQDIRLSIPTGPEIGVPTMLTDQIRVVDSGPYRFPGGSVVPAGVDPDSGDGSGDGGGDGTGSGDDPGTTGGGSGILVGIAVGAVILIGIISLALVMLRRKDG